MTPKEQFDALYLQGKTILQQVDQLADPNSAESRALMSEYIRLTGKMGKIARNDSAIKEWESELT